jgi:hypothetical protein
MEKPEVKGLRETLGVTDEQFKHLADLRMVAEARTSLLCINVLKRGGNIHGVNHEATAKRRKANKVAHKQRMKNR